MLDTNLKKKKKLVAFRKYRKLIFFYKSKVHAKPEQNNSRFTRGLYKCMNSCLKCLFMKGPYCTWSLKGKITCETKNINYLFEYKKDNCKTMLYSTNKQKTIR